MSTKPDARDQKPDRRPYKPLGMARARQVVELRQPAASIKIGGFTLTRLMDGVFWLLPPSGEGMATSEAELERMLRAFWRKKF